MIEGSGLPPYRLSLKKGCVVILLRNIRKGLCNGTRLIVKEIKQTYLYLTVLTGQAAGKDVYLPRMELTSTNDSLPFKFKRVQYPVVPCFAITINKAQGQTFNHVGVCLDTPVFCHGQLYVGLSRVTQKAGLKVQFK
jgi:ATP-dependent DNA helicase PIF1